MAVSRLVDSDGRATADHSRTARQMLWNPWAPMLWQQESIQRISGAGYCHSISMGCVKVHLDFRLDENGLRTEVAVRCDCGQVWMISFQASTPRHPTSTPKCNTGHSRGGGVARAAGMAGRRGLGPPDGRGPEIHSTPFLRSGGRRSRGVREDGPCAAPRRASGSPAPGADARPCGPAPPSPPRR